jgi:hypothetical protein
MGLGGVSDAAAAGWGALQLLPPCHLTHTHITPHTHHTTHSIVSSTGALALSAVPKTMVVIGGG